MTRQASSCIRLDIATLFVSDFVAEVIEIYKRVEGSAKLKGETWTATLFVYVFCDDKSLYLKITMLELFLKLTLCTPRILSKVSQVAQKQSTRKRFSNALSCLPMASKDQPIETRKTQLFKERVNLRSFQGRKFSRLQEDQKHGTGEKTRWLNLEHGVSGTNR